MNSENTTPLFPMMIDLSESSVMIIGSDDRLSRYVTDLSRYTRHLYLLSTHPTQALKDACSAARAALFEKKYSREDLFGMDMVVCASKDPEVNNDVSAICRTMGIRVCIAGDPAKSDFHYEPVHESSMQQQLSAAQ